MPTKELSKTPLSANATSYFEAAGIAYEVVHDELIMTKLDSGVGPWRVLVTEQLPHNHRGPRLTKLRVVLPIDLTKSSFAIYDELRFIARDDVGQLEVLEVETGPLAIYVVNWLHTSKNGADDFGVIFKYCVEVAVNTMYPRLMQRLWVKGEWDEPEPHIEAHQILALLDE